MSCSFWLVKTPTRKRTNSIVFFCSPQNFFWKCPAHARPTASPSPKIHKSNEKSMIGALELPGTLPECFGTAQGVLKAPKTHSRRSKMSPKRPKTLPSTPQALQIGAKMHQNPMNIDSRTELMIKAPQS